MIPLNSFTEAFASQGRDDMCPTSLKVGPKKVVPAQSNERCQDGAYREKKSLKSVQDQKLW